MIGTGVFTTLGLQVQELQSKFTILLVWMIGGIIALTGALSYAEVALTIRRSGGEYTYLSEIYHPQVGFISGLISLVVGFAAPMAALAIAIGEYLVPLTGHGLKFLVPSLCLTVITGINLLGVKPTGLLQNILTLFKIILLLSLALFPLLMGDISFNSQSFLPKTNELVSLIRPEIGIALIYVSYSFSGWNASIYIAGQLENPEKNIPRSLILGTMFVSVFYLFLVFVFLNLTELHEFEGKIDIINIVVGEVLGEDAVPWISGPIGLALLSSLNGLVISGPRVLQVMGEDYKKLKFFSRNNSFRAPYRAIIAQYLIAMALLLSWSFSFILKYIGITLSLCSLLVVFGLFILRKQKNRPSSFKVWAYPVTPILFILINTLMIIYLIVDTPVILIPCISTLLIGALLYLLLKNKSSHIN
jgi:APA family basic amino acid/polyamine antiporter